MPEVPFESFVYDGKMLKDRTREELYTVIEELVHEFNFAKEDEEAVLVDARKIFYAMKTLKEKLYA